MWFAQSVQRRDADWRVAHPGHHEGATGEAPLPSPVNLAWRPVPSGVQPIYEAEVSTHGDFAACGRADRAYGYVNSCPHLGTPLDWQVNRFISLDSGHIMCATHGALFEVESGSCVDGPCVGQNLEPLPVVVDGDGRVRLVEGHSKAP